MGESSTTKRLSITAIILVAGFVLGIVFARLSTSHDVASLHSASEGGIGIPALVQQVRQELIASDVQRTATNMPALFVAKSVDLEISFVAKQENTADSKVSLRVVDVDAKHGVSSEQTQKMTIHLDIQQPQQIVIPPSPKRRQK